MEFISLNNNNKKDIFVPVSKVIEKPISQSRDVVKYRLFSFQENQGDQFKHLDYRHLKDQYRLN